jgi:3-deoxy-7-phosphoheptulonate synthase
LNFNRKRSFGPSPKYPNVLACKPSTLGLISIAGPCSIESVKQMDRVAREIKACPESTTTFLRGGIWKAGTYPPEKDFGLQKARLSIIRDAGKKYGLKTIVEVLDVRHLELIDGYVDAFQIGARHCQDYALLVEASKSKKPVTLKRNMGMKLDEFLGAAEYLAKGRCTPILIERGGSSVMDHVRWDLSISLIAAVKRMTNLPVLVDASHGTGRRDLVQQMTLAGMTAGADGYLVEIHPDPCNSVSDTDQAYPLEDYRKLATRARWVWEQTAQWYDFAEDRKLNNSYIWNQTIKPGGKR